MRRNKIKRWMTFQSIFAVVLITAFLIFIAVKIIKHLHEENIYKPIINPTPKHFIMIKGTIDPRLKGEFKVIYQTANKACQETVNWFEGVYAPRDKSYYYKTTPLALNHYKLQIPLDILQKGFCQWELSGIGYLARFNDRMTDDNNFLFGFNPNKTIKSLDKKTTLFCYPNGEFNPNFFCNAERYNQEFSFLQKVFYVDFKYLNRSFR